MQITDQAIDQAHSDLKGVSGGVRNDYFGLLYLERELGIDRQRAISQVAFGGNDYGLDGFHFDSEKRNLYLFQFKCSKSHTQFRQSFTRLIDAGMERIFGGAQNQDPHSNQLLQQLRSCLIENEAVIDRVLFHFVFMGDPQEAEKSQVLSKLREDLENKNYLIKQRFDRDVTMVVEFRSAETRKVGAASHLRRTHSYPIELDAVIARSGPDGERMTIGFIRLKDLHSMLQDMGQRFFERNIRDALPADKAVNRSIERSLKRIVLDAEEDPSIFAFNHNGVTLSAEALEQADGHFTITEPRLLNGAQTVTTLKRFCEQNEGNKRLGERSDALASLHVMCRIITRAKPEFITTVTISNNRQNPVEPWSLHANDTIQLELQDKFEEELKIYYERQQGAFENLSDEYLDEHGITETHRIELTLLARTFLISDGEIDKLSRFREVFEEDRMYAQVFNASRVRADARKIVLCYKIQFRLRRLLNDILERGRNRYGPYVNRARNMFWALLCQSVPNDSKLEERAEAFGRDLRLPAQFTDWLSAMATTRCRFILGDLVADKQYADKVAEENFSFLRSNAAYKRAMEIAHKRWGWVQKRLNR
jgi:hypothetical protein